MAVLYLQLPAEPLAAALANAQAPSRWWRPRGGRPRHHQPHPRLRRPQDPTVLYSPDDIVTSLGGLVIDKAERVRRPVQTDQGTVEANDTMVRFHHPITGPDMTER